MRDCGLVAPDVAVNIGRTLVFAVIAVALGAYIYLVEQPRMQRDAAPDLLLSFDQDAVSKISLSYPDADDLLLTRRGESDWWLSEPLDTDADDATVKRLLKAIGDTKVERRISAAEAAEASVYGLEGDGTRARVALFLADGSALPEIVVGGTTPVGYSAFARVGGSDEVAVTPLLFHTGVKKSVFDVRNKKLFSFTPSAAIAISLTSEGRTVKLSREGDLWRMTAPVEDRADRAQIDSILSALNNLQATAFFQGDKIDRSAFGLEDPTLSFSVELAESEKVGFKLGTRAEGAASGFYLERNSDGQVATIDEAMRNRFAKDADALRDKHLFECGPSEIAAMRFQRADGDSFALLLGDDDSWSVQPAGEEPVREGIIRRTRSGLASLAATNIAADGVTSPDMLAVYGLETPVVEVELSRADGSPCGTARAGMVSGAGASAAYYAQRDGDGTVLSLPEYMFSRLDVRRNDFLAIEDTDQ